MPIESFVIEPSSTVEPEPVSGGVLGVDQGRIPVFVEAAVRVGRPAGPAVASAEIERLKLPFRRQDRAHLRVLGVVAVDRGGDEEQQQSCECETGAHLVPVTWRWQIKGGYLQRCSLQID